MLHCGVFATGDLQEHFSSLEMGSAIIAEITQLHQRSNLLQCGVKVLRVLIIEPVPALLSMLPVRTKKLAMVLKNHL